MEKSYNSDSSENSIENISNPSSENEDLNDDFEQSLNKNPITIYDSIEDFLSFASQNKKIKVQLEVSPLNPNYYLKDISLHKKGPLEDKLYANHPIFYYNIRRGNTILEIYDMLNDIPKRIFCRKGLLKFYDISLEILEYAKIMNNPIKNPNFLTKFQKKTERIIFEKVERLQKNSNTDWKSLEIHKIYKENGEHCQIGYIKLIDAWLIASKNVTILLRTPEDLDLYIKARHYWPKLIAEQWFEYLANLTIPHLNELKESLNGLTLLGEHCGHPKHTHIIEYSKIEIIFYAIIDNSNSRIPCLSPKISFDLFKRFGLKSSKRVVFGEIGDYQSFLEKMEELLREIELSNCEKEGEGSVIYVSYQEEVISMCKMKTIEYLIFRNLREHLKKQVRIPNIQRVLKYNEEVKVLFHGKNLQKSRDFYLELGKNAFEYIARKENHVTFEQVYYNYVDLLKIFLKELSQFHSEKTEDFQIILVTPPLFLGSNTNEILKKAFGIKEIYNTWREEMPLKPGFSLYNLLTAPPKLSGKPLKNSQFIIAGFSEKMQKKSWEMLEDIEKSGCSHNYQSLVSFFKKKTQKDRAQMIENLAHKIPLFLENLKNFGYSYNYLNEDIIIEKEFIDKIKEISVVYTQVFTKSKASTCKELMIFFMIGIPGMGKSYFCQILEQIMKESFEKIGFFTIAIDEIRHEIQSHNSKNPGENSELYLKTVRETSKKFYSRIAELLTDISTQPFQKNLLFLDKNHTQTIHNKTLEFIHENLKTSSFKLKIFGLIPSNPTGKFFRNKEFQYPFSTEFILNCLFRCLNRENHETLSQDPIYRVKVLLKFLQIFRNFKFKSLQGIDDFIEIPFHKEGNFSLNGQYDRLLELMSQALDIIDPKCDPKDSPIYLKIVEEFYRIFKEKEPPIETTQKELKLMIFEKFKAIFL